MTETNATESVEVDDRIASTEGIIVTGEFGDYVEVGYNAFDKSMKIDYPIYLGATDAVTWDSACVGLSIAAARELRDKLIAIVGAK